MKVHSLEEISNPLSLGLKLDCKSSEFPKCSFANFKHMTIGCQCASTESCLRINGTLRLDFSGSYIDNDNVIQNNE